MFVRLNYAILLTFENCQFQYHFSSIKVDNILSIKLITRIRLGFSHLREHKHCQNFPVSPICTCGTEPEITEHSLLSYQHFYQIRSDMLDNGAN